MAALKGLWRLPELDERMEELPLLLLMLSNNCNSGVHCWRVARVNISAALR